MIFLNTKNYFSFKASEKRTNEDISSGKRTFSTKKDKSSKKRKKRKKRTSGTPAVVDAVNQGFFDQRATFLFL